MMGAAGGCRRLLDSLDSLVRDRVYQRGYVDGGEGEDGTRVRLGRTRDDSQAAGGNIYSAVVGAGGGGGSGGARCPKPGDSVA
jgi:hypothetical protein